MGEYVRHIKVKAEIETNKMTYITVETVRTMADGEAAIKEFFDGFREEFNNDPSLLDRALEIIRAGLLLRMHGDIEYMPMSQREWDMKAEAFLRENEEN